MKTLWILFILVGVARGWGCDLVSEGKVLCEITNDSSGARYAVLPDGKI